MSSALEGVADLTAQLNELGVKLAAKELKGTVKAALQEAEHRARANIPIGKVPHKTYRGRLVSPGYAVSTLHIETGFNKKTGAAFALLGVGPEAFYVVQFIEFGTFKDAAQPWLRPAFYNSKDQMLEKIKGELVNRIARVAAKRGRG